MVRSLRHRGVICAVTVAAVVVSASSAVYLPTAHRSAGAGQIAADKPIPVTFWKPQPANAQTATSVQPAALIKRWPAGQSFALTLSGGVATPPQSSLTTALAASYLSGSGWSTLGTSGITVGQLNGTRAGEESALSGSSRSQHVTVDVLSMSGTSQPTLRISNPDSHAGIGALAINIPASLLSSLYGADYAGRVRWVQTANPTRASRPGGVISSGITVGAIGSALLHTDSTAVSSIFLTGLSGASSATGSGDFSATPLRAASSWQVSAQTGAFAWSYPFRVPPAAAGPVPALALSYDSQSVDGETGSSNNQPSAIGDGWSLAGAGFIDRSYVPCNQASTPITTGDLCWFNDNATVSFAGHSGRMVKDATTGSWHLSTDDNTKIEYLTDSTNATADHGYWKLTDSDGTQYFFGRGSLPGGGTTNSAWTVPVCGTAATACSGSGASIAPFASQGWRWNLDYVVDTHGNAEAFHYTPETGYYTKYSDSVAHPTGTPVTSYIRGGQLTEVDYGMRATASTLGAPSGKVLLETGARCESGVSGEPSDACTSPLTAAKGPYWPDSPLDQNCQSTGACATQSPLFWTTQRLADVRTQVLTGGLYDDVDRWDLTQTFPKPGDGGTAALWLAGINHTGLVGTGSVALPATTFGGLGMQNRVWPVDGYSSLDRFRLSTIHTESGATISVNYSGTGYPLQCTSGAGGTPSTPQSDTKLCYQQWWTPPTAANVPPPASQEDWFNTYVALSVTTDPGAGQDPDIMRYDYTDPGWRLDTSPVTAADKRTWSDFAGFAKVEVTHGNPMTASTSPLQSTTYSFFQGLNDDPIGPITSPTSTHRSAYLDSSDGSTATHVADSLWFAGQTFETIVRNGQGGSLISDTVNVPWSSAPTASATLVYSHSEPGTGGATTYASTLTFTAQHVGVAKTTVISPLSTGVNRTTSQTATHDGLGRVISLEDRTADAGTTCTTTTYDDNSSANLLDFPEEVRVVKQACSASFSYTSDALSDTQTTYDGTTYGSAPTIGDAVISQLAKTYSTSGPSAWSKTKTDYDVLGRVTNVTDPLLRQTPIVYYPSTSGPMTSKTTQNTMGWQTTTDYDPSWGNPLKVTDVNNLVTTVRYDALGRTVGVWQPGNPGTTSTPIAKASMEYGYSIPVASTGVAATSMTVDGGANVTGAATSLYPFDSTKVTAVSSIKLGPNGNNPAASYVLFDGLLRQRQTQTPSPKGTGEIVSDTFYNAQGQVATSWAPWYATATASGNLVQPGSAAQIPSQTFISYDGAGRSQLQQLYTSDPAPGASVGLVTGLQTSWAYPGIDRTDVTPPSGAAITSTFTDSRGRTTQLRQFHGPLNATTRDQRSSYDLTSYGYDVPGRMTGMTDDAGNQWSWTFDVLGRQVQAIDPDKGSTSSTYDDGNRLVTTTDARTSFTDATGTVTPTTSGVTLYYSYDDLDRKTGEFVGSASGRQLAAWNYDTLADGSTHEYGQETEAIRYTAGVDGPAYISDVTGFDNAGRPTGTAVTIPNDPNVSDRMPWLAGTYTTGTLYNIGGSVSSQVEPDAGGLEEDTLTYSYNDYGNLSGVQGGTSYATGIQYTGIGQVSQILKAATTRVTDTYGYDAATGRTTNLISHIEDSLGATPGIPAGTSVSNRVYTYDPAGDITAEKDSVTGDNQCFTDDYAQRLTNAWTPSSGNCADTRSDGSLGGPAPYWQNYSYDSVGDRTQIVRHAITSGGTDSTDTYNYGSSAAGGTPLPNAVSSVTHSAGTTDSYTYDVTGNTLTRPGVQSIGYDAEGHSALTTTAAGTQRDIYDADGNRLLQIESAGSNAGATLYLGDTELHVAATATSAIGTRTYTVLGNAAAVRIATPGGTYPTNLYWTETDLQNTAETSIRTNATSTSAVTNSYTDPFGGVRGSTPTWPNQHGFLNGPSDALSATTHLGARDYDPTVGRFLTVDSILDTNSPQSLNGYAYANNNPATVSDPSGLHADDPTDCNSACGYDNSGNYNANVPAAGGYVPPPGHSGSQNAGINRAAGVVHAAGGLLDTGLHGIDPHTRSDDDGCWSNPGACGSKAFDKWIGADSGSADYTIGEIEFNVLLAIPTDGFSEVGAAADVIDGGGPFAALLRDLGGGGKASAPAADPVIGFTDDTVGSAFQGLRAGGGHAIRHLRDEGLISNTGSLKSQVSAFEDLTSPILTSPSRTFDWTMGGTRTRAFAGSAGGKPVVLFVAKEGPYQGRVLSAVVPDANQITQWKLP